MSRHNQRLFDHARPSAGCGPDRSAAQQKLALRQWQGSRGKLQISDNLRLHSCSGAHDETSPPQIPASSRRRIGAAGSFSLVNQGALSQAGRIIKLVVPLAPGGGADILARILAEQIARGQGPTVVVENGPGAGTESVARAAPNGNTLLINTANIVIGP
jgi:hypothetical protein